MKVILRYKDKKEIYEKIINTKRKAIYLAHSNVIIKKVWEWAEVWHIDKETNKKDYLYFDSKDFKKV